MIGVGFEPTPPKRLVPKTSALDRSAIQPMHPHKDTQQKKDFAAAAKGTSPTGTRTRVVWVKTTYPDQLDYWGSECAGRESNPGLVRGRDVYYHCTTGACCPRQSLILFIIFYKKQKKQNSETGNRTPGICVTGRDVTNYTISDLEYLGFDPSTSCLLSTHASDCANTP